MTISPGAAAQAAQRGLRGVEFNSNPDAAAAYAAGRVGVPLFVTRLDEIDRHYYLVPWETERGITLVVQVDATSGEMSSFAAFPTPVRQLVMSPGEAKRVAETRLGRRASGEPRLVWRPSRESASSLQPLYHIPVDQGEAFVSVDGSVYSSLTPFGRGG